MPSNYFETYGAITLTASATLTDEGYLGRRIILHAAAGLTATLPAATGSGNRYEFLVRTTISSNSYIIRVANSSDTMVGVATLFQDAGDTVVGFAASGTHDTITLDGTTRGGIAGARVVVDDIAANLWAVQVISDASGTEATPFSATV